MNSAPGRFLWGLILVSALSAQGADRSQDVTVPDLTQGAEIDHALNWTLGPTGARGWVFRHNSRTELSRQIYITGVHRGSPADGILAAGDVILGIDSKPFDSNVRKTLAAAIATVQEELMTIPRAAEIIEAHQAINRIKQLLKDGEITREQAIAQLISYRDKYDINDRGPNLVYWFSLMWSDRLKTGRDLK